MSTRHKHKHEHQHEHLAPSTEHPAPYMAWAKSRTPAKYDLAASNLLACSIDDLPGAREALSLDGANENGYPPLLEAIAARYGVATSRVMTGNGCSGANFLVMAALLSHGDEVVLERPYYDPLAGAARLAGATVRPVDRKFADGYALDIDALEDAMTRRTRLVVLTNPHNPSGALLDDATIAAAAEAAARRRAHLLVDEVYLDIVNLLAEGPRQTPAALLGPNVISTSSLTKSYGLNALRCGWAIASDDVAERIRRARDVVDGIAAVPVERLSVVAFGQMDTLADRARAIVSRNLDAFRLWMIPVKQLELAAPARATIVFPRVKGVRDTRGFAETLRREHDVDVVPGHFFGAPRHIRISLAGRPDILQDGLSRLSEFLGG
ncbi:MAG TPA: pyridoxal phosphate-dependent aminotransferase [Vicinamibacterales bacterium]